MKLLVRKSRHHQKEQDIHQLKNQNQQLQDQISQLQALQKENPTQARTQTIKNLSKKQGNIYSRLNGLGAEDDIEREREREREREQHRRYCLNFQSKGKFRSKNSLLYRIIVNWIVRPLWWVRRNLFLLKKNS